jgi:DNA polymerase III subunit delta'
VTLFGLDTQISAFRAAVAGERMHHAWLLAGPRGVGKGSFADFAARLILNASDPGSQGASLLDAGSHPDFRRLERLPNEKTGNLARNITVDQVRLLRGLFATGTAISDRRVIIIDSIDDMERGASNAVLKSLEEPPASTIFLLVSHQPGRLLPTIRSRCRTMMFGPLNDAAMTSVLDEQLPDLDPAKRAQLIANANGSPATALAYAELDMATLDAALTELAQTGDPTNAVRSKLAQSLALKAALPRYEAFLGRAPAFIAERARTSNGAALDSALSAWSKARALSQIAIPQSLVAETVVFEMAGHVASLAHVERAAKA